MEQAVTSLSESINGISSLDKPVLIKDVTLLAPGIWTGEDGKPTIFSSEEIEKGFSNTNWDNMNLFLDHKDKVGSAVAYWAGFVKNPKMLGGKLVGDLEVWHPLVSMFIKKAKARFGVSAIMSGVEELSQDGSNYNYKINSFKSMSLVDDPGCEVSWLPKVLSGNNKGDKKVVGGSIEESNLKSLAKVTAMEEERKKRKMSVSEFYAVPRDPPSLSSLPIFDVEHVRNVTSRFNQTHFDNPSQKKTAWNKIFSAAKKFGIKISKEDSGKILNNCKEVKKMEEENQTKENKEKEETSKEEETSKSTDEKSEETVKEESNNEEVKELSKKVDKLFAKMVSLTEVVEKSLSAGEEKESEEESTKDETEESEETSEEKEETTEEENDDSDKELEETKKELSALKAEINSPDRKTLASDGNPSNVGVGDSNAGMLSFLREKANIPIY